MSIAPEQPGPQEIAQALDAARYLIQQGVPVFVAPPKAVANPLKELEFYLPNGWQQTEPDVSVLDTWQPGMALCAVMGRGLDLIDVDTYKGATAAALDGLLPTVLGTAATPSGGEHYFVASLGVHSKNDAWPGIDVKAGGPDGAGRGFAFIAPTVRTSKADGQRRTYSWAVVPTLAPPDGTGRAFAAAVLETRKAAPPPTATVRPTGDVWQDQGNGWYQRRLTQAQATQTVQNAPAAVIAGRAGDYRKTLYAQAALLGELTSAWVGDPIEGNGWLGKEYAVQLLLRAAEEAWGQDTTAEGMGQDERIIADGMAKGAREPRWVVADNVVQPQALADGQTPPGEPQSPLAVMEALLVDAVGLRSIQPPEPLVTGWLFKDSLAWLIGAPGQGKTFAAVDLACSIATGTPWQGHPVQRGRVLYLIAEGVSGLSQRVDAWSLHHGLPVEDVVFLPVPVQLFKGEQVAVFAELVAKLQPELVVIDTQARVTVGAVENAAEDMGLFVHNLARVQAAAHCCVLTVHHSPRGAENPRGSSAIEGASDTILHAAKTERTVTLKQTRQKDVETRPDLELQMVTAGSSVVLTSSVQGATVRTYTDTELRVLNHMKRGNTWSAGELHKHLDIGESTAYKVLGKLRERGDVYLTDSTQPKRFAATVLGTQVSYYQDGSQPGNAPLQPVDNPVDNPEKAKEKLVSHLERALQGSPAVSPEETPGQSDILQNSPSVSTAQPHSLSHPPTLKGGESGETEKRKEPVGGSVSPPQALPDMPEPAPKKRAEPRPGTKAYERAQAKAAEKAERIALAAGGSVQYPAVVLRDGQVLESPLSTAEELLGGLSELTVDVESSGVPIGHKDYELRLVQLGNDEFAVDLDPKDPAQMELAARVLAAAPVLHAHSSTADIVPLAHAGHVDFDSAMERMDDTAIRAKLNDPQSTGSDAGLKRISDYMLGADSASTPAEEARAELFKANGWLSEPKADTPVERNGWYQVDPACKTFARYGGSDVLDTALIAKRLAQIPPHIAARENAVAHMVSRIALKGIKLNGALIGDLMTEHVMKRDEWAKAIQSWTSIENVGSDKQVAQALLGMGVRLPYTKPSTRFPDGQPSVAAGVLETLQGELDGTGHPAATLIEQVLTWRHHDTAITLFLTPYSVLVNDGDGRARPTVYTLGADTGRMSCTRPNIQQLPREGGFRAMFVADEGMTFISADFSSVEIRVAAALSQDQALIRMLAEGSAAEALVASGQMTKREWQERYDPHAMAARMVYGPDWTKANRYAVKRGVFGRIYGGGVSTLAAQMRVSVAIAQKLIDAIDTLWPTLSAWSKASTQAVERGLETTFTTYSGRVVHLPKKAAHAAGNYKIQGTARELLVDALMRWRETKWGKAIMWPVHDELDVMVPIEDAEAATAELVRCMETELFGVRIVAEPSAPSPVWQDAA